MTGNLLTFQECNSSLMRFQNSHTCFCSVSRFIQNRPSEFPATFDLSRPFHFEHRSERIAAKKIAFRLISLFIIIDSNRRRQVKVR